MTTNLDYLVVYQVVLETKGNSLGSSLAAPLLGMDSKAGAAALVQSIGG
jgi:di/tripeptidase